MKTFKHKTCQYNEYETPRGCRKRATRVIQYEFQWGERLNGNGSSPVYGSRVTFRCENHTDVQGMVAHMGISDYMTELAKRNEG